MEKNDMGSLQLNDEQKADIKKLISQSRKNLIWTTVKFCLGLFGLSILTFFIMIALFTDSSSETQSNFIMVCNIVNAIFMYYYLYGKLKSNSEMIDEKIKEILKKSE